MNLPSSNAISPEVLASLEPHWQYVLDDWGHDVPLTHVDQLNSYGEALIHIAAWKGTVTDIRWLLDNGANLEQRGEHDMTPLHYAYIGGKQENIEALLKAGADRSARTEMGLLPAGGTTAEGLRAEKDRY
jgi:ankyrin repeat protein